MSGNARSRLARNSRSTGTSYATSSPVSRAAIPLDALHNATPMPMMTAVPEPFTGLPLADLTAWVNTPDAPAGSTVLRPFTSR